MGEGVYIVVVKKIPQNLLYVIDKDQIQISETLPLS